MKRIALILIVMFAAPMLLFAAGEKEGSEQVTLTIAGRDGSYGEAMQLAADTYSEQNPNVDFEILKLSGSSLLEQTVVDLRSGTGSYDLILIDDPNAPRMMEAGWLANLENLYQQAEASLSDDFISNIVELGRHPYGQDGTLYALPHVGNVELFAYRTDLAEKYGFSELTDWRQVMDLAGQISNNEQNVTPILFRGAKSNPIVTGFLPIYWSFGARILNDNGQPAFNTSQARNALNYFLELSQYAPEGVSTWQSAQVRDALYSGTGAIAIEVWPGWIGDLDNPEESEVVGQVRVTNHPGRVRESSPLVGVWLTAIPESSDNKMEAFRFLRFLTSEEMQRQIARETGVPPTRVSVHRNEELREMYPWYPAQLSGLQSGVARPRTDAWSEIETAFGNFLQQALIGDISAEEALNQTQQRVGEIVD